jgi:hypothetical protein
MLRLVRTITTRDGTILTEVGEVNEFLVGLKSTRLRLHSKALLSSLDLDPALLNPIPGSCLEVGKIVITDTEEQFISSGPLYQGVDVVLNMNEDGADHPPHFSTNYFFLVYPPQHLPVVVQVRITAELKYAKIEDWLPMLDQYLNSIPSINAHTYTVPLSVLIRRREELFDKLKIDTVAMLMGYIAN